MNGDNLTMEDQAGNHAAIPFLDTRVGDWTNEDIDNNAKLNFGIVDNKNGSQTLSITGSVTGDHFPSGEGFVTDAAGNSVFLGVSDAGPASHLSMFAPYIALAGKGTKLMYKVNVSIVVNGKDRFIGVVGKDGKIISI